MVNCPYKGLLPYTEEDTSYFFGRDKERRMIAANLRACRLTLLYGASGVGKTSVLWAGVAHDLKSDPDYVVVLVRDWRDALTGFHAAVRKQIMEHPAFSGEIASLESADFSTLLRISLVSVGRVLLIVLDQFEDYFQYHPDENGPGTFAEVLPALINDQELPVHFLISIREDSLASLDYFKRKIPGLFDNRLGIDFLSPDAATDAIVKPLEQFSKVTPNNPVRMGHDLAHRVVGMITEAQGGDQTCVQTPYLQLVLTRWWEQEMESGSSEMQEITLLQMGGVKKLVDQYLEMTVETLEPQERKAAAAAFAVMVTASGRKIAWTISDLAETTALEKPELLVLLEKLRQARVIAAVPPPSGSSPHEKCYEFAHDVVAKAALEWRKHFRQSRDLAETRAKASRLRQLSWILGVLLAIALLTVVFELKKIADIRGLISSSMVNLDEKPELSLLLAIQAFESAQRWAPSILSEAENQLRRAILFSPIRHTLSGHKARVRSVAWSPDGRWLATASEDHTAKIWDVSTGEEKTTLLGHRDAVSSLAWSPDGSRLATGSWDRTAIVWDPITGKPLHTLGGQEGKIWSIAWDPDGSRLAIASADERPTDPLKHGELKIWDIAREQVLLNSNSPGDQFWSVAWSQDGTRLAAGVDHYHWNRGSDCQQTPCVDHFAKILVAGTGRTLLHLSGHTDTVLSVAWNPDSTRVATGSADYRAKVWDSKTGKSQLTLEGHSSQVYGVAWSPDGRQLATGSRDHTIKIWDAASGEKISDFSDHAEGVTSVAWNPNGEYIGSGSGDRTARIWEVEATEVIRLRGHTDEIWSVAWSPDGKSLATGSFDRTIRTWNISTGEQTQSLLDGDYIDSVAWSPDGSKLASGNLTQHVVKIWEVKSGRLLRSLTGHDSRVTHVVWRPDGKQLASSSFDGTVRIWDLATGNSVLKLCCHPQAIWSVAWSPDGKKLATASRDHTARIWNGDTGKELLILRGHSDSVIGITWSSDGKRLATGSADHTVRIWDANSGKELSRRPLEHGFIVWDVAWSPNGMRLGTASALGTTKVWDRTTGDELLSFRGHKEAATSLAWSPDGNRLATSSQDRTVQVYAIDSKELLALARRRVTRQLTDAECDEYLHVRKCN